MTTNYNVDWNKKGVNGFGSEFSDQVYSTKLEANTEITLAVPLTAAVGAIAAPQKNKFLAIISVDSSDNVFVALNATAAVPAGATFAASKSPLIPGSTLYCKSVEAGDVLHFISPGTPAVTVEFYAIQE